MAAGGFEPDTAEEVLDSGNGWPSDATLSLIPICPNACAWARRSIHMTARHSMRDERKITSTILRWRNSIGKIRTETRS